MDSFPTVLCECFQHACRPAPDSLDSAPSWLECRVLQALRSYLRQKVGVQRFPRSGERSYEKVAHPERALQTAGFVSG